jgi:hypothetical protein
VTRALQAYARVVPVHGHQFYVPSVRLQRRPDFRQCGLDLLPKCRTLSGGASLDWIHNDASSGLQTYQAKYFT